MNVVYLIKFLPFGFLFPCFAKSEPAESSPTYGYYDGYKYAQYYYPRTDSQYQYPYYTQTYNPYYYYPQTPSLPPALVVNPPTDDKDEDCSILDILLDDEDEPEKIYIPYVLPIVYEKNDSTDSCKSCKDDFESYDDYCYELDTECYSKKKKLRSKKNRELISKCCKKERKMPKLFTPDCTKVLHKYKH